MYKFGEIVYLECYPETPLVVLRVEDEDAIVASEDGDVQSINGSFIWSYRKVHNA